MAVSWLPSASIQVPSYLSRLSPQAKSWSDISYTLSTDTGTTRVWSAPAAVLCWPTSERAVSHEAEWFYARLITRGKSTPPPPPLLMEPLFGAHNHRDAIDARKSPVSLWFCHGASPLSTGPPRGISHVQSSRKRAKSIKFQLNDRPERELLTTFEASQVFPSRFNEVFLAFFFGNHSNHTLRAAAKTKSKESYRVSRKFVFKKAWKKTARRREDFDRRESSTKCSVLHDYLRTAEISITITQSSLKVTINANTLKSDSDW